MKNETTATNTDTFAAILAQYEQNNKPKTTFTSDKEPYNVKNYFSTILDDKQDSATKTVRILPKADGTSPFEQVYTHKAVVDGKNRYFACLAHTKKEDCPFCEANAELRATGEESDKELAKKYAARLMYIVKLIDRDNEKDGVKFWRFSHDFRKEGVFDKIHGVLKAIKKDITNPESGRDLFLTINRNQSKIPIVSSIVSLDPSPLSEDAKLAESWLTNDTSWQDVYSVRTYDYLEIIVKGGAPKWDKNTNKWVDESALETTEAPATANSEIAIGGNDIKSNIVVAESSTDPQDDDEDSNDDLPF